MPRSQLIRFRAGTAAEWASADPVLAANEPGYVEDTGELRVGDGVSAFSALTGIFGATLDNGTFVFDGPVRIGPVTLTPQPGTIDSLLLDGQILSAHDALYRFAEDMRSSGTDVPETAQDVGMARWSLPDAATHRVKMTFQIPAEWDEVAFRFLWCKEVAASGNVNLTFEYTLFYPFAGDSLDAKAVTTISLGSIAVPGTVFAGQYEIPASLAALATADGAFGSKPFMMCSIERDGAADTYNSAISIAAATLTRTT